MPIPTLPVQPEQNQSTNWDNVALGAGLLGTGAYGLNLLQKKKILPASVRVAHTQGKFAALHTLGLKQAAFGASTLIPRAANATGSALYNQKLQQLAMPAARRSIANPAGTTPSLYTAMMGHARPGESGTSLAFRRHIMGETRPGVQQFAPTMPVPSVGMAPTMAAPRPLRMPVKSVI